VSDLRQAMEAVRAADERLAGLEPVPWALPARGLEAVIAGGVRGVERTDWIFPGLRERVGAVLRGCPVERLIDGHAGARPWRVAPVTASPAARLLHACGLAMARPHDAALCFLGQGGASYGALHEALNLAALRGLDVIFLATRYALDEGAPVGPQVAGSLAEKAAAYGIAAIEVDGADAALVAQAVSEARAAGGPHFIEAHLTPGRDPLADLAIEAAGPAHVGDEVAEEEDLVDLSAMTVSDLRAIARARGVAGYSRMRKADLIAALSNP